MHSEIGNLVVKLTTEGFLVVDQQSNIVLLNPAAERMTEAAEDEATGLKYTAMARFENAAGQALDIIAGAKVPGGLQKRRDLVIVGRKSGQRLPVETVVVPYEGGALVSIRDITQELAKESEQSEFISTASHEMRTPVASIRGFIELCLNQQTATIDARARDYLGKAQAASEHLGKLFQDLLDATQLDDKRSKLRAQPIDFTAEIKKIADEMAPTVKAKGLAYQFGDSERQLEQALYVRGDLGLITEIMNNLIENAVKYTASGSVTVRISGDESFAMAAVTDTGVGIAPSDAEHVFQKFYRADNSDTRTIGGTGLGLYIAQQRAAAMGGKIVLDSEPGRGSTFTLILPRISQEEYDRQVLAEQNNAWVTGQKVVE
jgi:PAS domain S-box-containing protein